jgi:hypothetical protein
VKHAIHTVPRIYGLLAQFDHPEELLEAASKAHAAGFRRVSAYTPFPIEGLSEVLGKAPTRLPLITLVGGILGGISGFGMQYWACVISYPMNIGGRPDFSWPAFIPITFEMTILGASLCTVLGMLALNGLPQPYHPLFSVPEFESASRDRFFLAIESRDPQFDIASTSAFLMDLHPSKVMEVPK